MGNGNIYQFKQVDHRKGLQEILESSVKKCPLFTESHTHTYMYESKYGLKSDSMKVAEKT